MGFIKEKIVWPVRYRLAVKRAEKLAHDYQCKQYVILCGGKLIVMSRRDIEMAVARGIFRKGVNAACVRKKAIYVAS